MWARIAVGALIAALIGGAGTWVIWAKDQATKPDRAEVIELIDTYSPYNIDQSLINHVLEQQQGRLDRLEEKMDEVQEGQTEMLTILRRLEE
jgi:hypothetical protein